MTPIINENLLEYSSIVIWLPYFGPLPSSGVSWRTFLSPAMGSQWTSIVVVVAHRPLPLCQHSHFVCPQQLAIGFRIALAEEEAFLGILGHPNG